MEIPVRMPQLARANALQVSDFIHLASVRHTTVSMTNATDRVEIITSVQRRRRWTASEKVRMVEETFEPGMTVSLVARRHGVAPNQLFTWRRLVSSAAPDRRPLAYRS